MEESIYLGVVLKQGARVNVLEHGKKVVDKAIIYSCGEVEYGVDGLIEQVQIKSILSPNKIKTLVFFKEGWRMVRKDPMTRAICFSKCGYWFTLEPE